MIQIIEGMQPPGSDKLFDAMFRDRKRVFVDLRGWNVPVIAGEFEVDQFDGPRTVYCIATDEYGAHHGSIRLIPTDEPHILGDIFPDLCDGEVPTGSDIWELTRACPSPDLPAAERRRVRNALITAVVEYARHRLLAISGALRREHPLLTRRRKSAPAARAIAGQRRARRQSDRR